MIREELYKGLMQVQDVIREDIAVYFENQMLFSIGLINNVPHHTECKPVVDAMMEVYKAISTLLVAAEEASV